MTDVDDEKTELKNSTYLKAMNLTGGALFWVLFACSYMATSGFSQYR